MFNALASLGAIEGARVLDLFAGSGALGIEALSRGASHVTFVDPDRAAREAIATNLASTGFTGRASVVATTAEVLLAGPIAEGFSLVLLDPPYGFDGARWSTILDALAECADTDVVVIESSEEIDVGARWDAIRTKRYGGTLLTILQPSNPPSHDPQLEPT